MWVCEWAHGETGRETPEILTLSLSHPNQIHEQGGLEHPVEANLLVVEQVLQATPGAVFRHDAEDPRIAEQSQKHIEVLMPHFPELRGRMETSMSLFGSGEDKAFPIWKFSSASCTSTYLDKDVLCAAVDARHAIGAFLQPNPITLGVTQMTSSFQFILKVKVIDQVSDEA